MKTSTAIFSTNDPFVSIKNVDEFKEKLGSNIIIQKNKGHFEEGKTENIPILLKEILED
jgi:predicted alpha/beta hydrolase family esterase